MLPNHCIHMPYNFRALAETKKKVITKKIKKHVEHAGHLDKFGIREYLFGACFRFAGVLTTFPGRPGAGQT